MPDPQPPVPDARPDSARPDPDALLARMRLAEEQARRGKLKIFFGASAGVGKTFAMLTAARQLAARGADVVVGIVETHGRGETAALLDGLEALPLRAVDYRGHALREFDLDAALARRPALVLVDELAHSNVPGSRHPKRWQDIDELLDAGIDVFTTVNVQHIESLNDIVGGITGIRVRETVPDKVFDEASEVVVVDLPPDELLQRLREGKVYMAQQAERAIRNFFRKGNLIALRELALRRTADRVDDEMREYRQEQAVAALWKTRESLLVCIGPRSGGEKLVRAAARLANRLDVPWHAVYVETPRLQRLATAERERILKTLKLAQEMGADTATLPGTDVAGAVADYAREHNLARIVIGRGGGRAPWRSPLAERIGRLLPDIDVVQIAKDAEAPSAAQPAGLFASPAADWRAYLTGAAACALTAVATVPLFPLLELTNTTMIFLLVVVLVGVRFGRGPALLAALLNVAALDFLFVSPRFSFNVSDVKYVLTFVVMFVVALITGQLAAGSRYQARVAMSRELRARALYEMSRELSAALLVEQIVDIAGRFIEGSFRSSSALLLADPDDRLQPPLGTADAGAVDIGIAQWAFDHGEPAGSGTDTLPGAALLYLPLRAPMRFRGVLAVAPRNSRWLLIPEQRRLLDTFASLIAIAVERVHYVDIARATTVQIESERLRNSLLSALSHDLRTPLTALLGFAEYLELATPPLAPAQRDAAAAIRGEAQRMAALVDNLLDMGRLQAGAVTLNRQWQPLEEVIGATLGSLRTVLHGHRVAVHVPPDLPLLEFDAVLMERVFFNLLENAAKYTPAGSRIEIDAAVDGEQMRIAVEDDGPGLPAGSEEELFKKFARGQTESATPGVGLGLAICRAIVEAHGGRIRAGRSALGGARFVFTLPLGTPPPVDSSGLLAQPAPGESMS